jgi:dienelactone hydrolase
MAAMNIRLAASAMAVSTLLSALAQVPAVDARVGDLRHTNYHFQMPEYPTLAAWEARKAQLVRQVLSAAGLLPMPARTPLHPRIFGRIERPEYSVEKVLLETWPGFYLGGNLYRPKGRTGKLPAIVNPHGHWNYGRLEQQPGYSGQALAGTLAMQGHVVFAYDMLGYNDTQQTPHTWGSVRDHLWSFTPLGLQLWNSIRVVDFLSSLTEVDPERIGATGASGGGTQTFLLTAVDARVRFSAPVNMVSAIMQGGCGCENTPGLRIGTNNMEIAAMMAPRPMLLVAATGDWTRNVPHEEFPAIRKIYALYGKPDNIEAQQFNYGHNYNKDSREAVYRFFGKYMLGENDPTKLAEKNPRVEGLHDLLALYGRALPEKAVTFEKLAESWREASRGQVAAVSDAQTLRDNLRVALAAEWPAKIASDVKGETIVLSRASAGDRVTGLWFPGKGTPALVVDPAGSAAARKSARVADLLKSKRPVLLIDAFHAVRTPIGGHFTTFNPTDDACRVQDILTALAWLHATSSTKPELVGFDKAAVWSLFAAAVAPIDLKLDADLGSFKGSDDDFIASFFVPGIQRAGGLDAALKLTANRK